MPWKPGQSGNPGGRRKTTKEQLETLAVARKGSPKAMRAAVAMLAHKDPKVVLAAMRVVLEYGLGKPTQVTDIHVTQESPEDMPRAEQIAGMRRALEVLEAQEAETAEGVH